MEIPPRCATCVAPAANIYHVRSPSPSDPISLRCSIPSKFSANMTMYDYLRPECMSRTQFWESIGAHCDEELSSHTEWLLTSAPRICFPAEPAFSPQTNLGLPSYLIKLTCTLGTPFQHHLDRKMREMGNIARKLGPSLGNNPCDTSTPLRKARHLAFQKTAVAPRARTFKTMEPVLLSPPLALPSELCVSSRREACTQLLSRLYAF